MKHRKSSVSYDEWLMKQLKNHELAAEYLNNALRATRQQNEESLELLRLSLKNVIQARIYEL